MLVLVFGHGDQIRERAFDRDALEELRSDPDFDYSENRAESGSIITLFLAYLVDKVLQFFEGNGLGWMTPWLFRLFIISVMLALIIYLLSRRLGLLFFREAGADKIRSFESVRIQKEDYHQLLQQAVRDEEYRLAIRYLFLQSLQSLDGQGRIKITSWKAPYDYMKELPEQDRSFFKQLTDLFETTWYGEYDANEDSYQTSRGVAEKLLG